MAAEASSAGAAAIPGVRAGGRQRALCAVSLAATLLCVVSVLWHFHDQFWWAPDEGAYAHIADRVLAGEVLNRDVQDVHPGYVNFTNAAALAFFGRDLVSLRYPLVLAGLLQAALMFALLAPRGLGPAASGAMALTALSTVQFLNPTAHWYCLALCVAVVASLAWIPPGSRGRLAWIGFLVGTLTLYRQLSGAIVGVGVVSWLLFEAAGVARGRERALAVSTLGLLGGSLALYALSKASALTLVLFAVGPLALLLHGLASVRVANRDCLRLFGGLALGVGASLLPLIAYHAVHGSLASWLQDTVVTALGLSQLAFFESPSYLPLLLAVPVQLRSADGSTLAALFWTCLVLAPALLSALVLRDLRLHRAAHPLPYLAVFYALVSVHYAIPIYLTYSAGLTVCGLLWCARRARPAALLAVSLSIVGLVYHAGQPLSRKLSGILVGERVGVSTQPLPLPAASLRVEASDGALYAELVALVEAHVPPEGSILAIPANPELYFMTGRRNPERWFNSSLGLLSEEALMATRARIERDPPHLVFYQPEDKYDTDRSRRLMEFVRGHYTALGRRGEFEIYAAPREHRHARAGLGGAADPGSVSRDGAD